MSHTERKKESVCVRAFSLSVKLSPCIYLLFPFFCVRVCFYLSVCCLYHYLCVSQCACLSISLYICLSLSFCLCRFLNVVVCVFPAVSVTVDWDQLGIKNPHTFAPDINGRVPLQIFHTNAFFFFSFHFFVFGGLVVFVTEFCFLGFLQFSWQSPTQFRH